MLVSEAYEKIIDESKTLPVGEKFEAAKHPQEKLDSNVIFTTAEAALFTMRFYTLGKVLQFKPEAVVDVGCGAGELRNSLRRNNYFGPYIGIDVRDLSHYHKDKQSRFVMANLLNAVPLKPGSCECIVFSEVLEHLPREDGQKVMPKLIEALTDNGKLVLTTPVNNPDADMEKDLKKFGHVYYYDSKELMEYVESIGRIEETYGARFIGNGVTYPTVKKAFIEKYGQDKLPVFEDVTKRFGTLIANSMFHHVLPHDKATNLQMVIAKK